MAFGTPVKIFVVELTASIKLFDPIMMRITDKAGDAIVQAAIPQARKKTGSLRKSIKNQGAKKGLNGITVLVTAGGESTPHDVDYAVYQEEGTSRMSGTHFMRKATNKVVPQWEKEVADVTQLLAAGRAGRVSGSIRR